MTFSFKTFIKSDNVSVSRSFKNVVLLHNLLEGGFVVHEGLVDWLQSNELARQSMNSKVNFTKSTLSDDFSNLIIVNFGVIHFLHYPWDDPIYDQLFRRQRARNRHGSRSLAQYLLQRLFTRSVFYILNFINLFCVHDWPHSRLNFLVTFLVFWGRFLYALNLSPVRNLRIRSDWGWLVGIYVFLVRTGFRVILAKDIAVHLLMVLLVLATDSSVLWWTWGHVVWIFDSLHFGKGFTTVVGLGHTHALHSLMAWQLLYALRCWVFNLATVLIDVLWLDGASL